jgi:hypothetical protein
MTQDGWTAVWERLRAGRHVVVISPGTLPTAPSDLQVLRVSCELPGTSGGALEAARHKVEQLLGEELVSPEPGQGPRETGLRHRFLGDLPGQPMEAMFVEACNRLADRATGHTALAFEAIDAADDATVDSLGQIFRHPGWLRLPLLLTVRSTPQSPVAELIYLVCHEDDHAVMAIEGDATPSETAAAFDWAVLPPDVLRVLRAGAVLGTTFAADVIARLLDEPLGVVLEKLQWAADAGTPLADRGEGRFSLPPALVTALQNSLLPSLLTFCRAIIVSL